MTGREQADERASTARGADEDFLFHLYRGSDLLVSGDVEQAKEALEHALRRQPEDPKGQDLLAGVYFRLGVYPRAIEIWLRLLPTHGDDATLRVNLALALLKTGQPGQALEHIHVALGLAPEHDRAWGYLGLIQWRLGRIAEAREAFLRGGQASMARRMEDVLGSSAGVIDAPANDDAVRDAAAVRSAAEQAMADLELEPAPLQVEATLPRRDRAQGDWDTREPGEEVVPRRMPTARGLPAAAPPRLATAIDSWMLAPPAGVALAVGPAGELFVHTTDAVHVRLEGVRAMRGASRGEPVARRARGRMLDGDIGGDRPVLLVRGPFAAVIDPPAGERFVGISLDGDSLYVREDALFAFDAGVRYESGRLPLGEHALSLVQLHGTGTIVLALSRIPAAIGVGEQEPVHVAPGALVGWTGRLFPDVPTTGRDGSALVSFRGDGVILVS